MKKLFTIFLLFIGFASMGQTGSINFSVGRSKVTDTATVTMPSGYGGLRFKNQASQTKWQFTNDGTNWFRLIGGNIGNNYVPKFSHSTGMLSNSLVYDNGSDIGVNTTSINAFASGTLDFEIKSASTSNGGVIWLNNSDDTQEAYYAMTTSGLIAGTNTNHPFIFRINNTEVGRITTGGNIGYGTTSPTNYSTNARHLELKGSATNRGGVLSLSSSDASQVGNVMMTDGLMTVGPFTNHSLVFNTNNTERFRINTSGALGINGSNFGTSGQVLTSAGSGSPPSWTTGPTVSGTSGQVAFFNGANSVGGDLDMTFSGSTLAVTNIDLGTTSISGNRTIAVKSSTTDAGLNIIGTQGDGTFSLGGDLITMTSTEPMQITSTGLDIDTGGGGTVTVTDGNISSGVNTNLTLTANGTGLIVLDGMTIRRGSATLDFPDTPNGTVSTLTITVTGVALGDVVSLGAPVNSTNSLFDAVVTAANTVTVRFNNYSTTGSSIDPGSGTFKVVIFSF